MIEALQASFFGVLYGYKGPRPPLRAWDRTDLTIITLTDMTNINNMKKIVLAFALVAVATVFVMPAGTANASTNYYYAPSGYGYQYQPVAPTYTYGYGTALNQEQLAQYLRQLIAQLQAQLASRPSYDYYGGYYGYKYNYVVGEPRGYGYRYDDDDDDDHYGDDEPTVETRSATDIGNDDARLRGYVDMNDYDDGEVFFVYGTDRDQVEEVEDEYDSYSDVDQDGERLRKMRVDSSLEGSESYENRVSNLDEDTRYYFSICVGYDDDEELDCGSVLNFRTED